jgi:hypothetical protein
MAEVVEHLPNKHDADTNKKRTQKPGLVVHTCL